jgi:DNA (cytosine-5)-methyltransferase 3A
MKVLSLFDGISVARASLESAGIQVETYYASEIDKHAIAISKKNYPDIIQLGSVVGLTPPDDIDLLIGGSPCQDLSIAKKDRKGLEGDRSGLFWEYVRIKEECKPTYFILENVASMPKKDRDIITTTLGVQPVLFNASLVSAQCRKRLFWTNIRFELPEDRGILLKHILQPDGEVDERMMVDGKAFCLTASYQGAIESNSVERKQRTMVKFTQTAQTGRNETKKLGFVGENDHQAKRVYDDDGKLPALNVVCNSLVRLPNKEFTQIGYFGAENQSKVGGQALRVYDTEGKSTTSGVGLYKLGHIGNTDSQGNRVYDPEGKSCTLSANGGGLGAKTGLYQISERKQSAIRDGDEKSRCLLSSMYKGAENNGMTLIQQTDRIRKLTPIECERLQSLPDNYTEGVAKTHRYKCLGNAFNMEVVAHILKNISPLSNANLL